MRVRELVGDPQTTGRADALPRSLTSKETTVSVSYTVDAQGNRVSEVAMQLPRSEGH